MSKIIQPESSNNCRICKSKLFGSYCSDCGVPNQLRRIDRSYIWQELRSILNFEKGIFYSMKELLLRPGKSIRKYIHEDRKVIVKPITFIIACSLIYVLSNQLFQFDVDYKEEQDFTASVLIKWFINN